MSGWLSGRLRDADELTAFDCGVGALNNWLRESARRADIQGTARVFTWTRPDDMAVVAFYAISPTEVHREGLSRAAHGGNTAIPAYLLGRLALDRGLHGKGLGTQLLLDAVEVIVAASESGGGRLLVVDAIDDAAASFYRAHGFAEIIGTRRLYCRISALGRLLAP